MIAIMRRVRKSILAGVAIVGLLGVASFSGVDHARERMSTFAKHPATFVVLNPSDGMVVTSGVFVVLDPSTGQVVRVLHRGSK